jgi:hypothetical protein
MERWHPARNERGAFEISFIYAKPIAVSLSGDKLCGQDARAPQKDDGGINWIFLAGFRTSTHR